MQKLALLAGPIAPPWPAIVLAERLAPFLFILPLIGCGGSPANGPGEGNAAPLTVSSPDYHFVVLALETRLGPGSRSDQGRAGVTHQRSRARPGRTGRDLPARLIGHLPSASKPDREQSTEEGHGRHSATMTAVHRDQAVRPTGRCAPDAPFEPATPRAQAGNLLVASRPGGYAVPATPIKLPSGSAKWPTTRPVGARSGPIRRFPPRLSAFCRAASTSGTPT